MPATADSQVHHVDVALTTPTPPPICPTVSTSRCSSIIDLTTPPYEAPHPSLHFTDGMVIDLTHESKVIYDLTDM
jgi:hypothetical protein